MNEKYFIAGVLLVFLAAIYIVPVKQETSGASIQYHSSVCEYLRRAGETDWNLIDCSENLFTDWGKNHTRDYLGSLSATGSRADYIALSNGTAAGCTNLGTLTGESPNNSFTSASGSRAQGTYAVIGTGNWSLTKIFTANETVNNVNATGLFNASSSGIHFACNNFTSVNLAANDQINITWTVWVQ